MDAIPVSVRFLEPEPHTDDTNIEATYADGTKACAWWGREVGGILAWRAEYGDEAALPYVAPAPVNADVNAERDRRVAAGKTFTVTGYGDIPVAGDATTQLNLLALKDTARDLKAASVTAAVIPYRDAENAQHLLTADQIIDLVDAGKAHVQILYSASWTLKAMDPIPADYADDSHWT